MKYDDRVLFGRENKLKTKSWYHVLCLGCHLRNPERQNEKRYITHHQPSPLLLPTLTPPRLLAAMTTLLLFTHTDHISSTQSSHLGRSSSAHILYHQSTTLFFEDKERDRKQEAPPRTRTMRCLRGRGSRTKHKNKKSCVCLKDRVCTGIRRTNIGSGRVWAPLLKK